MSFEDLVNKVDIKLVELIPDTNICIYLRDLYKEPSSIVKREAIWNELRDLLRNIENNDVLIDYSLGIEEACRSLSNFEINFDKLNDMKNSIKHLFEMNYFEMLEHSKLIKFDPPIKDQTFKSPSKLDSLESVSTFQGLLFVNYACLMKLFLLRNSNPSENNADLMIDYLRFVQSEVDLFSTSTTLFAHFYMSGNSSITNLLHKSKSKKIEDRIHTFWNAAIDLTFPALVSQQFIKNNTIPVFVTADERLRQIFDAMKIRVMINNGSEIALPPLVEVDLSKTNWSNTELDKINRYYDKIMFSRKLKFINGSFNEEKLINKLRALCLLLEKEIKNHFELQA
ncbi:hypothetical protein [Paenibacillus sp. FSL L8-0638]|uniref:hypothetical protein n=1 Tax=Paenibacillus TaxID=44249 RepID=UPI0031581386